MGNVWFTKYLHNQKIRTVVLHPGVIQTGLTKDLKGLFWTIFCIIRYPIFLLFTKIKFMGAQTILHLCYAEGQDFKSGEYYEDNEITKLKDRVENSDNMESFISFSRRFINHYGKEKDIRFTL